MTSAAKEAAATPKHGKMRRRNRPLIAALNLASLAGAQIGLVQWACWNETPRSRRAEDKREYVGERLARMGDGAAPTSDETGVGRALPGP